MIRVYSPTTDTEPFALGIKHYMACPPAPSLIDGQHDEGCVRLKAALLDQIGKLQLPTNFLDELIHQLGGPDAVAECTGRKGRIVADSAGRCCYGLGWIRGCN